MKIAIIGTRGIPAKYGGFETCAEELSTRLVKKGHTVIVSCRRYLYPEKRKFYEGVKLYYPPSIPFKTTDTFSHTFFSIFKLFLFNPDITLIFNSANSPFALILKLFGKNVVINVDGLEWKRRKWGKTGKLYYKFAEFLSCIVADEIICDSREIQKYYLKKYGRRSVFIPYGAYSIHSEDSEIIKKYGLKKDEYFFNGSRLEPENNQDIIIEAFNRANTEKFLAIVGDIRKRNGYIKKLKTLKSEKIKFLGPVYEKVEYRQLLANAYAYIHGNEVGGTNPALLQAMGAGNCILALDVPFNREVLGNCGIFFKRDVEDLKGKIEYVIKNPEIAKKLGKMARERVEKYYNWENVTESYEKLFRKINEKKKKIFVSY